MNAESGTGQGRGAPEGARTDAGEPPAGGGDIPLGQRLYDSPFVLLAAGLAIMLIFFTLWGIWEIRSLPPAPLP